MITESNISTNGVATSENINFHLLVAHGIFASNFYHTIQVTNVQNEKEDHWVVVIESDISILGTKGPNLVETTLSYILLVVVYVYIHHVTAQVFSCFPKGHNQTSPFGTKECCLPHNTNLSVSSASTLNTRKCIGIIY